MNRNKRNVHRTAENPVHTNHAATITICKYNLSKYSRNISYINPFACFLNGQMQFQEREPNCYPVSSLKTIHEMNRQGGQSGGRVVAWAEVGEDGSPKYKIWLFGRVGKIRSMTSNAIWSRWIRMDKIHEGWKSPRWRLVRQRPNRKLARARSSGPAAYPPPPPPPELPSPPPKLILFFYVVPSPIRNTCSWIVSLFIIRAWVVGTLVLTRTKQCGCPVMLGKFKLLSRRMFDKPFETQFVS